MLKVDGVGFVVLRLGGMLELLPMTVGSIVVVVGVGVGLADVEGIPLDTLAAINVVVDGGMEAVNVAVSPANVMVCEKYRICDARERVADTVT